MPDPPFLIFRGSGSETRFGDRGSLNLGGADPEVRHKFARLCVCEMMAQGISYHLLAAVALAWFGSGIDAQQGGYVPSIVYLQCATLAALVAAYRSLFRMTKTCVLFLQLNNQYRITTFCSSTVT